MQVKRWLAGTLIVALTLWSGTSAAGDPAISPAQTFADAQHALEDGDWSTARELFQQLDARLSAADPPALREGVAFYLAEIAYHDGRYPEAIARYQAVVAVARSSSYKMPAQLGRASR